MTNSKSKADKVKGAVLLDCYLGKMGDVVEFEAEQAEALYRDSFIDTHPTAVKNAEAALKEKADKAKSAEDAKKAEGK